MCQLPVQIPQIIKISLKKKKKFKAVDEFRMKVLSSFRLMWPRDWSTSQRHANSGREEWWLLMSMGMWPHHSGQRGRAGCKGWRGRRRGQLLIRALKHWAGQRVRWHQQLTSAYCKVPSTERGCTWIHLTFDPWENRWLVSVHRECLST